MRNRTRRDCRRPSFFFPRPLPLFFALSSSPFLLPRPFSSSSLCSLTPDTNQTRKNAQDAAAARNRGFRPQLTNGITLKGAGGGGLGCGPGLGAGATPGRASSGFGAPPGLSSSSPQAWHARATDVLARTRAALGPNAWIFDLPVDGARVPDYYAVVKQPMDLSTVARRLLASPAAAGGGAPPPGGEAVDGAYASPDGFMDDMRLVWANCALYNGKESDVGRLGARVEALFERAASSAGLGGGSRVKRATAGVAAPKYEPPAISGGAPGGGGGGGGPRPATSGKSGGGSRGGGPPPPSSSGGGPPPAYLALQQHQRMQREAREAAAAAAQAADGRKQQQQQQQRPSPRQPPPPPPTFNETTTPRSAGGAAGTASGGGGGGPARSAKSGGGGGGGGGGTAASAGAAAPQEMSYERMSAIGEALGGLDGSALEGALDIVRHALGEGGGEAGEVELDFDAIGPEALWRLDAYLVGLGLDTAPRGDGDEGGGDDGGGEGGGGGGGGGGGMGGGGESDSESG